MNSSLGYLSFEGHKEKKGHLSANNQGMENIVNSSMRGGKNKGKGKASKSRGSNFSEQETFRLLHLLRDVQIRGRRSDQSGNFMPDEWKTVLPLYNDRCVDGTTRSIAELRGRYKTIKKTFYVYKELAEKSGWGWNYDDNLPVAPSQETWLELAKVNKKYKGCAKKKFPWYKEMDELCGRNVASGANNITFNTLSRNLETVSLSDSSNSRADEGLDGIGLSGMRYEDENNYESMCDKPIDSQGGQTEPSIGNPSNDGSPPVAQTEPRSASSSRKRRMDEMGGESSMSKRKNPKVTENILEQILKHQEDRNAIFSRWVASRPNWSDPNQVLEDVMRKLSSNGISLGPTELTTIVVTVSNPWVRATFMKLDENQLREWISNLLPTSNNQNRPPTFPHTFSNFQATPFPQASPFTQAPPFHQASPFTQSSPFSQAPPFPQVPPKFSL